MGGLAKWAFGAQLQAGDGGAPEAFTTIAEVKDIGGPDLSADTEETTAHDALDGYEEFIPTILRSGEITFPVNFVPSHATHGPNAGGLVNAMQNRTKKNYRLVLAPAIGYTWSFAAYVTGIRGSEPVVGAQSADITLKITGKPTLAPS